MLNRCLLTVFLSAAFTRIASAGDVLGDSDCGGAVDFDDINCFVAALVSESAWSGCGGTPGCSYLGVNDINRDGLVTFDDIAGFVECLALGGCTPPPIIIDAELAGRSLTTYPFFDFVLAIQRNAAVEVAVDPLRFPEAAGTTARIYVVANKTAAQWALDNTLTDVTAGGFLPVSITATGVEANRFTVAAAAELASDAGVNLGVAYDVVVDLNENGQLDGGDLIDGRGDIGAFYYVKDLTLNGPRPTSTGLPYSVGASMGLPVGFQNQVTVWPTDIQPGELLPLVVISHGNGHDYRWYDFVQRHLASHGYIAMAHQNNTQAGIQVCSLHTCQHTDAILDVQDTVPALAAINGHIDSSRIVWIGHSRGGEGVARAYDRIVAPSSMADRYTPTFYTAADIRLVSSIAPTDFLGGADSNPQDVNYHLLYGAADGDVTGGPDSDIADGYNIYERASGLRQTTYVHGADHNDFNCCGFEDFAGPAGTAIGRTAAQRIARAQWLAMINFYLRPGQNVAMRDYIWRQYENLRPVGVPATVGTAPVVVNQEYKLAPGALKYVIDDYQTATALGAASSGATVVSDVQNLVEAVLADLDGVFTWSPADPMNGMSRARTTGPVLDTTRGAVFDHSVGVNRFIEWQLLPGTRDLSGYVYLSFRACQGTRHPETVAVLGDQTFTVTLRDGAGSTSSINIGAYGGGLEEPYQRGGAGVGLGWQNEFETIRIRLSDFRANGRTLNLGDVAAVRFDFGASFGTAQGRIAVDDVEVTRE